MTPRMTNPALVLPKRSRPCWPWRRQRPRGTCRSTWSSSCCCGRARSTAAACASTCTPRAPAGRRERRAAPCRRGLARHAFFSAAERAALALAESVTRLSDRPDPVPDEVWDEAARHFDEVALASLLVTIGVINVFNRLNVATRQVAGSVPLPA